MPLTRTSARPPARAHTHTHTIGESVWNMLLKTCLRAIRVKVFAHICFPWKINEAFNIQRCYFQLSTAGGSGLNPTQSEGNDWKLKEQQLGEIVRDRERVWEAQEHTEQLRSAFGGTDVCDASISLCSVCLTAFFLSSPFVCSLCFSFRFEMEQIKIRRKREKKKTHKSNIEKW